MTLGVTLGLVGALLSIVSYTMKNMMGLRMVALASNTLFFAFGIIEGSLPSIVLNLVLIPLNLIRVIEIRQLVHDIEHSMGDSPVGEWLLPHMSRRRVSRGEWLFRQGDLADEMYYIHSGVVGIPDLQITLGPGTLFGEIGIFSPASRRTQSTRCDVDCELYVMSRADVQRLYYKNPKLGFHLMRLIVARLLLDIERKTATETEAIVAS